MRLIGFGEAVHPSDLCPGDHVYTFRRFGVFFYTHHENRDSNDMQFMLATVHTNGIYVGNAMVVHLTRPPAGRPIPLLPPLYPSSEHEDRPPCKRCFAGPEGGSSSGGVVLVCLDCFCRDGSTDRPVRVYTYGMRPWRLYFNIPGTSTAAFPTRSPDEVIKTARSYLSDRDFGDYDLLKKNCEHFATFCVAGEPISEQADHWARAVERLDRLTELWFMWR